MPLTSENFAGSLYKFLLELRDERKWTLPIHVSAVGANGTLAFYRLEEGTHEGAFKLITRHHVDGGKFAEPVHIFAVSAGGEADVITLEKLLLN